VVVLLLAGFLSDDVLAAGFVSDVVFVLSPPLAALDEELADEVDFEFDRESVR
jgi:hypothetical protein